MRRREPAAARERLLDVEHLTVRYRGSAEQRPAVNDISFSLGAGESLAVIGESGCGKSTTALAIMGLLNRSAIVSGEIRIVGVDVLSAPERVLRRHRGDAMAIVFQEPMTALNPVHRIINQVAEPLVYHRDMSWRAARLRALELLARVRFSDPRRIGESFPHQLSGGQRQRAVIAMAIACEPKLLIADEATSAVDAVVRMQILDLLDGLRREMRMGLLIISHDLSLVSRWSERAIVMHHGEKLEEIAGHRLLAHGTHVYTKGLAGASLRLEQRLHYRDTTLPELQSTEAADGTFSFVLTEPGPPPRPVPLRAPGVLVDARNLVVDYRTATGRLRAVDDVSLTIASGEAVGIVGESGSGKSTLARALMKLVPLAEGTIVLDGEDVTKMSRRAFRSRRAKIQMIFQDPFGSLNPRMRIEDILEVPLAANGVLDRQERRRRITHYLDLVRLPASALGRFPHEFSGGQRQRICIARAMVLQPRLLICDEAVSALDVSVQAKVLNILSDVKSESGMSVLFISHDIAVVQYISDRVLVMKDGEVVEHGLRRDVCESPVHPYTRSLISAAGDDGNARLAAGGEHLR